MPCSCLGWGFDALCSKGHGGVCLCVEKWWWDRGVGGSLAGSRVRHSPCCVMLGCPAGALTYPSSVSLMMSQISMLRAQSSLCREPSVAFSEEKEPPVTKAREVQEDKLKHWGGGVW